MSRSAKRKRLKRIAQAVTRKRLPTHCGIQPGPSPFMQLRPKRLAKPVDQFEETEKRLILLRAIRTANGFDIAWCCRVPSAYTFTTDFKGFYYVR